MSTARRFSTADAKLYQELARFAARKKKKAALDISSAVNPDHAGYCTPMTKPTCTPQRKALAQRFKKGGDIHAANVKANKKKAKKHAEQFREGGNILRGMEVFAAGTHRGKSYTTADLDDMVRNFNARSTGQKPGFRVPLVVGHEEGAEQMLDRSDLPSFGTAAKLWRDGDKLKANFIDVPNKIAQVLRAKHFTNSSSEVYDKPPEGVPGKGKMLRRVAMLGGDLPQVKDLKDIPDPEPHSERFAHFTPVSFQFSEVRPTKTAGLFRVFSQVRPMDRNAMLAKLAEHGLDTEAMTEAPDATLAEVLRHAEAKAAQSQEPMDDGGGDESAMDGSGMAEGDNAGDGAGGAGDDGEDGDDSSSGNGEEDDFSDLEDMDAADYAEPTDETTKQMLAERVRRYADLVNSRAEHARAYMERFCTMADGTASSAPASAGSDVSAVSPGGNPMPKKVVKRTTETHHFSEQDIESIVGRLIDKKVGKSIETLQDFDKKLLDTRKEEMLTAFCEAELKAGHLSAREYISKAAGGPGGSVYRRLRNADAVKVEKFREGGKTVERTELADQMHEISTRSSILTERFGSPASATPEDNEIAEIEEHFEAFRDVFEKTGTSKETLVSGYKSNKKHDKTLTVKEYLQK